MFKIPRKTPVQEPFFNKTADLTFQLYYKRDSGIGVFL